MKRLVINLFKKGIAASAFIACTHAAAGGYDSLPKPPKAALFTGFSVLSGVTAINFDPSNTYWQGQRTGGSLQPPISLPATQVWSTSARLGVEYGNNFNPLYLGMNVNYFTGVNWRQAFTTPILDANDIVRATNLRYVVSVAYMLNALFKLGYTFTSDIPFLIYAQGGLGGIGIKSQDISNAFQAVKQETKLAGWVAGGGIELMLHHNFLIGADYQYSQYQVFQLHAVSLNTGPFTTGWFVTTPNIQTVSLYLKYIFNS